MSTTQGLKIHQRWMIRRDFPEVLAIESASFDCPWCEGEFLVAFRRRTCIGMVAELGDWVVGFMVFELHATRLELLDFAVHPDFRLNGIGRQMVGKLAGKLSGYRRTRLDVAVRESNLPALLFFRACGLKAVGLSREHFPDTGEDAVMMRIRYEDLTTEAQP